MAFVFQNLGGGSNLQKTQATPQTVDPSVIGKLQESGYNINPAGVPTRELVASTQPVNKQLLPGSSVPTYVDGVGTTYIVDQTGFTYTITQTPTQTILSPVRPPAGGGGVEPPGGGGGVVGTPPTPPVPPPPASTPLPPNPGGMMGSGQIYTPFAVGDVIPNQESTITKALWSNNIGNLITFYTSSTSATQKRYYYEIRNSGSSECGSEAQFSIAWGHKNGSGSADEGGQVNDTPSRAIYGQYRQLCLEPGTPRFVIGGEAVDHIYAINVNRARFREALDEGNIQINIRQLSGSGHINGGKTVNTHTGSNVKLGSTRVLRLIDDSKISNGTVTSAGPVYNIVSGSIEDGVFSPNNPHKYGLLYPNLGVAILSGPKLDLSASFLTVTGSEIPGDNSRKLLIAMSGAALLTDASGDRLGFQGRSKERIKSTHYFVRVKNFEYNFSNNPTFITGSEGDLAQPTFINDPQVYVTTVGLYSPRRELLAVAKLSKPLLKNFTREALIKVVLQY